MISVTLDKEFMEYWVKLSLSEKESLLSVVKNYVGNKENPISIEEYNNEIDEAMKRMDNNEYFTHMEANEIFKKTMEW